MVDLSQIQEYFAEGWNRVQSLIGESVTDSNPLLVQLNKYLQDKPGKQIRPILALLAAELWGRPGALSYINASMVEVLHTATLLHDDVADEADKRRGRNSVQKEFGRGTSILLGDYYIASALSSLAHYGATDYVMHYIDTMRDMCQGEIFQLDKAQRLDTSREDYYHIIHCKTARLFEAAMSLGAKSTGANQDQCDLTARLAYQIGIAFQIRDDIFDYDCRNLTGKSCGLDITEGKITLPLIEAMQNAGKNANPTQMREWILKAKEQNASFIQKINDFVKQYNGVESAQQYLAQHCSRAREIIKELPKGKASEYLEGITGLLLIRKA